MISVEEVVVDPDMEAPQPFTILRSIGSWVAGGFQSVTRPIVLFGPVQQATNKEISMLPEADRVGAVRSFWATIPVYVTRGTAPVPGVHGEVPQGAVPGTVYVLSAVPPANTGSFYKNNLMLMPGIDYTLVGDVLTLTAPTVANDLLWFQWPVTLNVQADASDIVQYGTEQYRVLSVYRVPGSGYWKALGTRMAAA